MGDLHFGFQKEDQVWYWKGRALGFNSALAIKHVGLIFLLCNQNLWDPSQLVVLAAFRGEVEGR